MNKIFKDFIEDDNWPFFYRDKFPCLSLNPFNSKVWKFYFWPQECSAKEVLLMNLLYFCTLDSYHFFYILIGRFCLVNSWLILIIFFIDWSSWKIEQGWCHDASFAQYDGDLCLLASYWPIWQFHTWSQILWRAGSSIQFPSVWQFNSFCQQIKSKEDLLWEQRGHHCFTALCSCWRRPRHP